jgi:GGDEF domain-containing protein
MSQADIAMYQAKRAGKNEFFVFVETLESYNV